MTTLNRSNYKKKRRCYHLNHLTRQRRIALAVTRSETQFSFPENQPTKLVPEPSRTTRSRFRQYLLLRYHQHRARLGYHCIGLASTFFRSRTVCDGGSNGLCLVLLFDIGFFHFFPKKMVQERLWVDHHPPHHHIHPKAHIVCPTSTDEFSKGRESPGSSDSEDLHYGPGIVNRLRNKYLSLALRESNPRPTILRKATSLENLLDDDGSHDREKEEVFVRRTGGNESGSRYRSSSRHQETLKRARSVEVISRANHEDEPAMTSSMTTKINNRQSLHEDMLKHSNDEKPILIETARSYKRPHSVESNGEEVGDKFSRRMNRPKRVPPLLNEREKPPVDVVKHTKMLFEKRPETRTKKPHHTGDVAAKVDSFNDIIVKNKVASKTTKPTIKTSKPVLTDKCKSNTHNHIARPVAKPIILSDEISKPKTLELSSPRQEKMGFSSLPSPIPDVSRVDKNQDGSDPRHNPKNSLCETPDLILTTSPIPKISSPTYRRKSTESFINEERNRSYGVRAEATNKYVSPLHSPTKSPTYLKPSSLQFNRDDPDALGFKMISPASQNNITKSSATSVYNFLNSDVDQTHLPSIRNGTTYRTSVSEPPSYTSPTKAKTALTAFEIERNLKNVAKSVKNEELNASDNKKQVDGVEVSSQNSKSDKGGSNALEKSDSALSRSPKSPKTSANWFQPSFKLNKVNSEPAVSVEQASASEKLLKDDFKGPDVVKSENVSAVTSDNARVKSVDAIVEKVNRSALKPVQTSNSASSSAANSSDVEERPIKIVVPKKTKRSEEATSAVFNFTARTDVPDYISNDTSRTPSRPVMPKPDEPGIKILPDAILSNYKEFQEMWEEDELIRSLEARPPSPCDVTFINDNVLIDGKSSLIQRSCKRVKLKISFLDGIPDIYEYPSELSLLLEETPVQTLTGTAQVGHTVPALSGSSLATYTPKTTEDFQLGVSKSFQDIPVSIPKSEVQAKETEADVVLEEIEKPVLFSSGSTSDILF
ncbi:uncharacterized protein DDB_G0284459 isoform X2 [Euwallacea fornicatus]|uniref:uncharacterized protein DDB_G0284459 isoform X2 n=1 Tax=Euwallacea fornicatus TaxID=995702 RepID=UPI00338DC6D4